MYRQYIHRVVYTQTTERTISTNWTEGSSDNNRTVFLFPPWKLFVSAGETNCFHGGNRWLQTDYLILRYVMTVIFLSLILINV